MPADCPRPNQQQANSAGCIESWWRCTDIGTRVVIAIRLNHDDDPTWYNSPPYAVRECVFGEDDMLGCSKTSDD